MGADHDDDGVISILVIDAASGAAQPLIADGNNPAWSPDGRRLIYAIKGIHGVLYVANASGQRLFQLTNAGADAWSPDWSP
jgi:Tol biopolymer transport system component